MGVPLNIDWQQILLHLFNFIILAGGLYLLLYKPVKNFMEKREAHYKEIDAAAEKNLADSEAAEKRHAELLTGAQAEIAQLRAKAAAEAEDAAKLRIEGAEKEKAKIISDARRAAEAEKSKIMQEANSEIEKMVSSAVDKLLVPAGANAFDDFLDRADSDGKE